MSSATPTVSVIMIFLNGERFIEEAIRSVFTQTYHDWELLLVDDGSTDGSTAIARRYAAEHPQKVRYLEHPRHENRGMSATRNLGIRSARGELIAFLDADDVYLPEKLERQVALLDEHRTAAMVYGPTEHWHSWTGRRADRLRDHRRRLGVPPDTLIPPPTLLPLFLRLEAYTPATCGVLIRREAIERIGGFEESFRGMFEDQAFFYKLCLDAPVFAESGCWDRYRQNPTSHSRRMLRAGRYRVDAPNDAYRTFLEWLEAYLSRGGVTDPALWTALRRELRPYRSPGYRRLMVLLQPVRRVRRLIKLYVTSSTP